MDAEVIWIKEKIPRFVLADDLKAVILGHADAQKRLVNDAADFLQVGGVFALAEIDTNEGHGLFS